MTTTTTPPTSTATKPTKPVTTTSSTKHSHVKAKPTPKTLLGVQRPQAQRIPASKSLEVTPYEGRAFGVTALKERDPTQYAAVVAALTAGNSLREIASEFKISKNTAGAIALRELGADFVKRTTVANLVQLVNLCSEDLLSEIDGIAPTQKAIILGICTDKIFAIEQKMNPSYSLPTVHVVANISDSAVERLIQAATAKHTAPQQVIDINP